MISQIPDVERKNPASRAQILMNPTSRVAVKSCFPPGHFAFFRILHHILVKSQIPKILRVLSYGERTWEQGFTPQWNLSLTTLCITKSSV